MKIQTMFFLFSMMACTAIQAQDRQDLAAIETAVHDFVRLGDQQNSQGLDRLLHPQFRAVVNRLFGAEEVSLMDKSVYLQLIKDKKIGGDKRDVYILSVDVVNKNATVKARFEGKALRFTTFLSLVKNVDGSWQVIGDMPDIEKV